MTDITDQDRRDILRWARDMRDDPDALPDGISKKIAAHILATVDAPPPSLMDRMLDWWTHHHEDPVAFSTLAESVDQMEYDLAEARAEVERLTAERVTEPSLTLNDGSMMRPATVAREENVSPDLPDPADVKSGEVWAANIWYGDEWHPGTAIKNSGGDWTVTRADGSRTTYRMNEYIDLIAPLVSEVDMTHILTEAAHDIAATFAETLGLPAATRVITTPDELDALLRRAVIRDKDGVVCERTSLGEGWYSPESTTDQTHYITFPATVLWEPEA